MQLDAAQAPKVRFWHIGQVRSCQWSGRAMQAWVNHLKGQTSGDPRVGPDRQTASSPVPACTGSGQKRVPGVTEALRVHAGARTAPGSSHLGCRAAACP